MRGAIMVALTSAADDPRVASDQARARLDAAGLTDATLAAMPRREVMMDRCELEALATQERHTLQHWRALRAAAQRKGDAQDLAWCEQRIAAIERLLAQLALVLDPRPADTEERERPGPDSPDALDGDAAGRPRRRA